MSNESVNLNPEPINTNLMEEQAMTENVTVAHQIVGQEYTIDPEFQNVFSAKDAEQYEALKESIRNDGVRDPLIVWDEMNILLDGHTRHQIYEELREELGEEFLIEPPKIIRMSFTNRDDAKMWMIHNQIMRRNLTTFQRVEAALQFKEFFAAKARENQKAGVSLNSEKGIVVVDELAKLAKTSSNTVGKVMTILANANKAGVTKAITALRRGDAHISIHSVWEKHCVKKRDDKTPPTLHKEPDRNSPPDSPINDGRETTPKPVDNPPVEPNPEPEPKPSNILEPVAEPLVEPSIEREPETILPLEADMEQSQSFEELLDEYIVLLDKFVAERSLPEERVRIRDRVREWANSGKSENVVQPLE